MFHRLFTRIRDLTLPDHVIDELCLFAVTIALCVIHSHGARINITDVSVQEGVRAMHNRSSSKFQF